jgi:4-hydroxy-tetrahydrodipicolinate reductase
LKYADNLYAGAKLVNPPILWQAFYRCVIHKKKRMFVHCVMSKEEGANMIKIAIPGSAGRMGGMLIREISKASDLELVAATDRPDSPFIGRDAGEIAQAGANGVIIGSEPKALFGSADVVIDFTTPKSSLYHAELAVRGNTAMVIGTTGLTLDDESKLEMTAKCNALVYCSNTSIGVTLLTQLVQDVATKLTDGWDIEILETHHHNKVDAPSGTALALGKAVAKGRGVMLHDVADMARKGQTGARKEGDIGFAVLRGGDVAGEHSVIFYGDSERIEISHRATDRVIFARGAIRAARFAAVAKPGFYDMVDVLKG